MSQIVNLDRRRFLKMTGIASGGLMLGATLPTSLPVWAGGQAAADLNVFVQILEDGRVRIIAHRSEMGQGIRTSLPQVVADELEADWQKVEVVQGMADNRYGSQNTDGSRSIRRFYKVMRQMGADARYRLEQAAADRWQVAKSECLAKDHRVVHQPTGRSLGYGDLAAAAAALTAPAPEQLRFKDKKEFKYIGKPMAIVDLPDIVNGQTIYAQDLQLPNMVIASIERAPVVGATIGAVDDKAARALSGVLDIQVIDGGVMPPVFNAEAGVAVIASNTWTAMQARKLLKIDWQLGGNSDHNSAAYQQELRDRIRQPGQLVAETGDAVKRLASASRRISAVYEVPYLAHATMEPPAAAARMTAEGVEVWGCFQSPQGVRGPVAAALGLKPEQVQVHVTLLGGGFGRKSKPDFGVEAAILAQRTGRTVKVVWSREDDVRHDYFHAISCQYFEAGLDDNGRVQGWLQRSAFPSIGSTFDSRVSAPENFELALGFADTPFEIGDQRCEKQSAPSHTRIGWLRSVSNIHHAFAIGSFVDELATAAKVPPDRYWLQLIGSDRRINPSRGEFKYGNYGESLDQYPYDTALLKRVVRAVAAKADFGLGGKGEGWGMSVHRSFLSYVGVAMRVSVTGKRIRVEEVHCAVDCGQVVNPDRVASQLEGAVVFGLSIGLLGEIRFAGGQVQNSNFHDYPLLRLNQCPAITVDILDSDRAPTGIGEPGVPPVTPALVNAIFAATGQRIRRLPVSAHLEV